ncbi:TPA: DJ-1 family protein [Candidatus Woesearchaeota archaeon]|nr:DJ-1 family protein [Candidatus Woesearchaeota archaeon]
MAFSFIFLLVAGCAKVGKQEVEQVKVSGKKILMVVAPENFRDEEFFDPKEVFESAGASVTVTSKGVQEAKGKLGRNTPVDIDISEADAYDFDAVVFVGGPGATVYFDDGYAHKLASDALIQGKVVAAICIAPSIIANAGILQDRKATAFESEKDNINAKSAGYTGQPVTVDGKVVTGNGPEAAKQFGEAIVRLLV